MAGSKSDRKINAEYTIFANGEKANDISKLTLEDFKHLGIRELLTMQRQVGFGSLIERVIKLANENFNQNVFESNEIDDLVG